MKVQSLGCTLDCFDCCKFNVYVEEGKVVKIEGDKKHPYTKGMICKKGLKHMERTQHVDRLMMPLLKGEDGKFHEISFEEAIEKMAEKLKSSKQKGGSSSVIYYEQYGSGSLLKSIGDIFFNFFGGAAKQKGGPCWSAGIEAQRRNFGDVRSHGLEDLMHSELIILWGKNPAYTSIHTMQMVKKAQRSGSKVVVIDPIFTETAKHADQYIRVQPGGDGALAMAMAQVLIKEALIDKAYISEHVNGYEAFKKKVLMHDMAMLCKEAGVQKEEVERLARAYGSMRASILLGYGLQKYSNGGNTIMLIDALGALSGQIGKKGGGVNYANRVFPDHINADPYESEKYADNKWFYVSELEKYIIEKQPEVIVVTKSNLLNQLPDLNRLSAAFKKIPFKVCFEQFMTDTAKACDLIIPCTTVLESEDLLYSSMTNPYLTYNERILQPDHPLMDEYAFFQALARKLEIAAYPYVEKAVYLEKVLEPLKKYEPEISLDYLKSHYFTLHQSIAWKDQQFLTPSGKFELFFEGRISAEQKPEAYPLRLLTNHTKDALFSQHFMDVEEEATAYINLQTANLYGLLDGEYARLASLQGAIRVKLRISEAIGDGLVMMYVGWWKKHGNPNDVTKAGLSDMGGKVTYNETFVSLSKIEV